jgi:hypothetical protein
MMITGGLAFLDGAKVSRTTGRLQGRAFNS